MSMAALWRFDLRKESDSFARIAGSDIFFLAISDLLFRYSLVLKEMSWFFFFSGSAQAFRVLIEACARTFSSRYRFLAAALMLFLAPAIEQFFEQYFSTPILLGNRSKVLPQISHNDVVFPP
jgi:hypothetical protein